MRIGELSRRTGVSVRMLRYYECEGLLRPERTPAGYRRFDEADVASVERVVLLNRAGLKLATVRRLLPCASRGSPGFAPCQELKDSVRRKLVEIDRQIAALAESRRLLEALAERG